MSRRSGPGRRPEVLSESAAERMVEEYRAGGVSIADLADRWGVGETTAWRVVKGKGKWSGARLAADRGAMAEWAAREGQGAGAGEVQAQAQASLERLLQLQAGARRAGAEERTAPSPGPGPGGTVSQAARERAERLLGRGAVERNDDQSTGETE